MNNTATKTHISLHKNRLRSQDSKQRTFAQLFYTVGSLIISFTPLNFSNDAYKTRQYNFSVKYMAHAIIGLCAT